MELIPLWLKLSCTAGAAVVLAVYWRTYGPQNYLWFSDIALVGTVLALWTESAFLASMMAVGVLIPELVWNFDFFARLLFGRKPVGLSDYMFDGTRPLYLRMLSLFHVVLPLLLLWLVDRLGFVQDAWIVQTALAWVVLPATFVLTDPDRNINWVFGPGGEPQRTVPPKLYLALLMAAFPLLVFYPTFLLLGWLFPA